MQKEMHNKLTRILYELNTLDKGPIRLKEMAAETGVSVRTIERDMNDIQEADFPLCNPESGSWAFVEGFSLEKMKLTGAEASILVLLNDLASSIGGDFSQSFALLKNRLLELPSENPFFIKLNHGGKFLDTHTTRTLEKCIRARKHITIGYQGGKKNTYCNMRPLKLIWVEGFWYLLALTDTDKLLKFRLEKISSVRILSPTFTYDKNIEQILAESTNIWFEPNRPLTVRLEISASCANYFKNKTYFPLQKVEKELKDGRLILVCQAAKEEEILPTILLWLPHIKVLSPTELCTRLRKLLSDYLQHTA